MQEREHALADGSLYYEMIPENGKEAVHITRFQGQASRVAVPDHIEGVPVTRIGKKAFLSNKTLRRVTLPDTLEEVGDWVFAYCSGLERVEFARKKIRFGRSAFLECGNLEQIVVRECGRLCRPGEETRRQEESAAECVQGRAEAVPHLAGECSRLLAAAVTMLDAPYLLDIPEAGTAQWLAKWDAKLIRVIHTPDQEGYSRQVLCGEEDYGSTDLSAYLGGRRRGKVRLCYLRLLYPQGLSEELRRELETYLRTHTSGRESSETWQVLLQEHGGDREYYHLFAGLGCVDTGNLGKILADIGDGYPEMKAFFLAWKGKKQETEPEQTDFFADFDL